MKITKTIPEESIDFAINVIKFDLPRKTARCVIESESTPHATSVMIDFTPVLTNATPTQLNTIKTFFKWILAQAYEVAEAEIPDTIFDPNA